jgi:hypothetical protein
MFNLLKNYKQNDLLKVGFRFIQIRIQLLYKKIKLVESFNVELQVSGKNKLPLMVFFKNYSLGLFTRSYSFLLKYFFIDFQYVVQFLQEH